MLDRLLSGTPLTAELADGSSESREDGLRGTAGVVLGGLTIDRLELTGVGVVVVSLSGREAGKSVPSEVDCRGARDVRGLPSTPDCLAFGVCAVWVSVVCGGAIDVEGEGEEGEGWRAREEAEDLN